MGGTKSHFAISNQPHCRNRGWIDCAGIPLRGPTATGNRPTPEPIPEGQRNTHLTSLAGALQRGGASREAIAAALMAENTARCTPPLDSSEVERIVASISRYPSAALSERGDAAEILLQAVLDHHFASGKSLTFGADGRFWRYSGKLSQPVPR